MVALDHDGVDIRHVINKVCEGAAYVLIAAALFLLMFVA